MRRSDGRIGDLTRAASAIGERLGMEVRTQIGQQAKIYLRAPFESGDGRLRIKIEVNTFERSPSRDLVRVPHSVESAGFTGTADVLTFCLAKLVSTKLRALFQRSAIEGSRPVRLVARHGAARRRSCWPRRLLRPVPVRRAARALGPKRTSVPSSPI